MSYPLCYSSAQYACDIRTADVRTRQGTLLFPALCAAPTDAVEAAGDAKPAISPGAFVLASCRLANLGTMRERQRNPCAR
jgi:hypothetical protein